MPDLAAHKVEPSHNFARQVFFSGPLITLFFFLTLTLASTMHIIFTLHIHPELRTYSALFEDLVRNYDLLCYSRRFDDFHTQRFFQESSQTFNYPAPMAFVYRFFYLVQRPASLYRTIAKAWMALSGLCFFRACVKRGAPALLMAVFILCLLALSYPVWIMLYLSNMELVVWIFLSLGIWSFYRQHGYLSSSCFGIAASLKYFPLAFLGLFSVTRDWRKICAGILVFASVLFGCLWLMGPTVAAATRGLKGDMSIFAEYYLENWHPTESGLDHSVYGFIKLILKVSHHLDLLPKLLRGYVPAMALLLVFGYFRHIRHLPFLNQLLALSIASIWITPLSHEYTLVNLYAPLIFLVLHCYENPKEMNRSLQVVFAGMGVLFAPMTFLQYHHVRFEGQVKCLVLGVLFVISMRSFLHQSDTRIVLTVT